MENNSNRILTGIEVWNQKVANLKSLFGDHITDYRYLVRAKLDHFKEIRDTYRYPVNQDEKIAGKILQAEIRRLTRLAFPTAVERFVRKAVENVQAVVRQFRGRSSRDLQTEMKNEVIRKMRNPNLSNSRDLNKNAGQDHKVMRAVKKDDDLLPKFKKSRRKGLGL